MVYRSYIAENRTLRTTAAVPPKWLVVTTPAYWDTVMAKAPVVTGRKSRSVGSRRLPEPEPLMPTRRGRRRLRHPVTAFG